jgi:hypothetical protein
MKSDNKKIAELLSKIFTNQQSITIPISGRNFFCRALLETSIGLQNFPVHVMLCILLICIDIAEIKGVDGNDDLGAGCLQIRLPAKLKVSPASLVGGVGFGATNDERLVVLEGLHEKQSRDQFRASGKLDLFLLAAIAQTYLSI